ncbi:MAG: zinc-dependent alcohol dehydrogenase family protein [Congregibacter sp.]
MQAVRINHTSDDLSGIEVIEVPVPEAAPGTLRVRMLKAALHPSDLNYIHGDYRAAIERLIWNHEESSPTFDAARSKPHPELPCIPGGEGVGIVEACGDGIDARAWMGKRVGIFAGPPSGTWQEHIIVAPQQLTPVPDALGDDQAALMMLNPLTALVASRYVLQAGEGQWLMMSAGASAVSKQVAALGRHFGFKTISLVRNDVNQDDSVQPLADVVINTTEQDFRSEVKRITNGRGVDFALDCVGGELASQMITCLTDGGRMLLYGTLSGPSMELFSRDLMMTNATLGGFYMPGWLAAQTPEGLGKVFQELGELSATGMFKTPIAAEYPLAQAIDAVRAAQEPGRNGKILLTFQV